MKSERTRVLIYSRCFYPSIGGLETATEIQGVELTALGYEVVLMTETVDLSGRKFPFKIVRRPSWFQMVSLIRWSNVFLHNGVSLQMAWPLLLVKRPWVIAHHSWISPRTAKQTWLHSLKGYILRFAENLCISQSIAEALPVKSMVMGEPYDEHHFRLQPQVTRDRDLIYLGRLVSDKGVDLLLEALQGMKSQGKSCRLTIVGDGEMRGTLEAYCRQHGLQDQVTFLGVRREQDLAEILAQHQVLVVPSRWEEPFGIVALEGIACGCTVVGSEGGGLKEAIGPCGLTFPNGNVAAMMEAIIRVIEEPNLMETFRRAAPAHLAKFTRRAVIDRYLQVLPPAGKRQKKC